MAVPYDASAVEVLALDAFVQGFTLPCPIPILSLRSWSTCTKPVPILSVLGLEFLDWLLLGACYYSHNSVDLVCAFFQTLNLLVAGLS